MAKENTIKNARKYILQPLQHCEHDPPLSIQVIEKNTKGRKTLTMCKNVRMGVRRG